mmetsp:Transcript_7415/g.20205  ORF Transcript_7415/g.20205 Transcript_7415/m.20205 type:complete len:363 (-) Transcript_7415:1165-2253(-)
MLTRLLHVRLELGVGLAQLASGLHHLGQLRGLEGLDGHLHHRARPPGLEGLADGHEGCARVVVHHSGGLEDGPVDAAHQHPHAGARVGEREAVSALEQVQGGHAALCSLLLVLEAVALAQHAHRPAGLERAGEHAHEAVESVPCHGVVVKLDCMGHQGRLAIAREDAHASGRAQVARVARCGLERRGGLGRGEVARRSVREGVGLAIIGGEYFLQQRLGVVAQGLVRDRRLGQPSQVQAGAQRRGVRRGESKRDEFVEGREDEFHKTPRRARGGGCLAEGIGVGVSPRVAPQPPRKGSTVQLGHLPLPPVDGGHRLQGEAHPKERGREHDGPITRIHAGRGRRLRGVVCRSPRERAPAACWS